MINVRTSRYRRDAITSMSDVRPSRFLGQSVDVKALEEINQTISYLEERMAASRSAYETIAQEDTSVKRTREVLLTQRNTLLKVLSDKRLLTSRIDRLRQQLNNHDKEAVDLEAEEKAVKEKCGVSTFYFSNRQFRLYNYRVFVFVIDACSSYVIKNERIFCFARSTPCFG